MEKWVERKERWSGKSVTLGGNSEGKEDHKGRNLPQDVNV